MAVSPLGNIVMVNQNTPLAAQQQSSVQNRNEAQAFAAMEEFVHKEKKVEETRPAEEAHLIDPDREHQKHRSDDEASEQKKREEEKRAKEEASASKSTRLLDIKV